MNSQSSPKSVFIYRRDMKKIKRTVKVAPAAERMQILKTTDADK